MTDYLYGKQLNWQIAEMAYCLKNNWPYVMTNGINIKWPKWQKTKNGKWQIA